MVTLNDLRKQAKNIELNVLKNRNCNYSKRLFIHYAREYVFTTYQNADSFRIVNAYVNDENNNINVNSDIYCELLIYDVNDMIIADIDLLKDVKY